MPKLKTDSIREVAKQAGVSTATVSRVFNAPELISASTRERVLETADRLNYHPLRARQRAPLDVNAKGVSPNEKGFIGFQFFSESSTDLLQANAFYAPLLASAQSTAAKLGLHLLVNTIDRHQLTKKLPKMVREQTVSGMLLVGTAEPEILALFSENVPQIILVDYRDPTNRHDCILSDGLGGALAATKYLFGLGHTRIAFLRDNALPLSFRDRLRGFVCAHYEAGRSIDPRLVVTASSEENTLCVLSALLSLECRPTALLAANDYQALIVMQVCRQLGLNIPRDLSLIGFDDIKFSADTRPPLTTVRVPKEQIGRLAVTRLDERLRTSDNSLALMPPVILEVPTSLIVRESCQKLF